MNLKHILIPALLWIFSAIVNGDLTHVDYCSDAYRCSGQREEYVLACNHKGEFAESCRSNAKILPMTGDFKQLFLHEHNYYRNEIAGGSIFEPAAAMATLEWDDELAYFAELNVKQCKTLNEEEKCFKTARYNTLGQNIGWLFYTSIHDCPKIYKDIKQHIRDKWYKEYDNCGQGAVSSYRPPRKQSFERFGKMVMDRNNRVGCAAVLFESTFTVNVLFTCNYARRLVCDKPIFRSSHEPGSQCKTGMNPDYPFLCSTDEVFNPNAY
ncbi:antigen 5 like allergen Cul n 1-like [Eurosta solidaginis]|uniref:antigen 5 like allergen Cul n 1-like n=1 Tax=Eurosta solidaginis TaxID=178769 RepID=UPI003530F049